MHMDSYTDSSGFELYLTPNLRPFNAGMLTIGQIHLEIPPNKERHEELGGCSGYCTKEIMTKTIYVERALNHMHKLGKH